MCIFVKPRNNPSNLLSQINEMSFNLMKFNRICKQLKIDNFEIFSINTTYFFRVCKVYMFIINRDEVELRVKNDIEKCLKDIVESYKLEIVSVNYVKNVNPFHKFDIGHILCEISIDSYISQDVCKEYDKSLDKCWENFNLNKE